MNLRQLSGPPDLSTYVTAIHHDSPEEEERNLRLLIKQGAFNIAAPRFRMSSIYNCEKELEEGRYLVYFVSVPESTAFADFYIERFSDQRAQIQWVKSKIPAAKLDGKSVKFRINVGNHPNALVCKEGNGHFRAWTNPEGQSRIEIIVILPGRTASERDEIRLSCPQHAADKIAANAPGGQFDFTLFEF